MTTTSKRTRRPEPATTAPITAGNFSNAEAEFCRIGDLRTLFGIKRGTSYNLIADGEIKSVCLRRRGYKQGCRLVSVASVREFLARLQNTTA